MDEIAIRGIRVLGCHGAYPGEADQAQPFDVDVVMHVDLATSSRSDDLSDTLDYAILYKRLVETVERTSFSLLERLAAELLDVVFENHCVSAAELSIGKPGLLGGATGVVTLRRSAPSRERQPDVR